ncbi:hypothetical protein [Succinimonas sp.]|uniref:hypothetical protein n=1 Tax=Succinimonas sp. TaxID=1936151 RepID=UPI0038687D9D
MVLFNIFGKKDGSENNSGESHASELAELRAKLARAEQERDELAREKDSLAQKVESLAQENLSLIQDRESLTRENQSLAQENQSLTHDRESLALEKQSLTQDKESLAQQVENLKQEYDSMKTVLDSIQNVVRPWPKTVANILNTAKKEGFNDDPLAHKDVAAIIDDIGNHLIKWLNGYAEHVRRFSGSHSKGYGNGSEKIDEAALKRTLEKLHESLTAETDAAASENSSEKPDPVTESVPQPDSSEPQAPEQAKTAEKKSDKPEPASQKPQTKTDQTKTGGQDPKNNLNTRDLHSAIEEIVNKRENGFEGIGFEEIGIETINKLWHDGTKDPNTRRMLAVSGLLNPKNIAMFKEMAERNDLDDNTKALFIAICQCCEYFDRRFFKIIKRFIKKEKPATPHPNGTKDRTNVSRAERSPSPKDCKENLPSVCSECKTPLKALNPVGHAYQVIGLLSMMLNTEEFVKLASAYPDMLYCDKCHKIFTPRIIDTAVTAAAPGYNINLLTLASLTYGMFSSIPVNTMISDAAKHLSLGHNTIYNNFAAYTEIILALIARVIEEHIRLAKSGTLTKLPLASI